MDTNTKRPRLAVVKVTNSTHRADKMAVVTGDKPAIKRHKVEYDKFTGVKPPESWQKKAVNDLRYIGETFNNSRVSNSFVGEKELRERKRNIYGNDAPDTNTTKGTASKFRVKRVKAKAQPISENVAAKLARSGNFVIRDKVTGKPIGTTKGTGNKIW